MVVVVRDIQILPLLSLFFFKYKQIRDLFLCKVPLLLFLIPNFLKKQIYVHYTLLGCYQPKEVGGLLWQGKMLVAPSLGLNRSWHSTKLHHQIDISNWFLLSILVSNGRFRLQFLRFNGVAVVSVVVVICGRRGDYVSRISGKGGRNEFCRLNR